MGISKLAIISTHDDPADGDYKTGECRGGGRGVRWVGEWGGWVGG